MIINFSSFFYYLSFSRAKEALQNAKKFPKKVLPDQKYRSYLLDKFNTIYCKPKWVKRAESKVPDSDSDDEVIGFAGNLKAESTRLEADTLKFSKCAHLTLQLNLRVSIIMKH